MLSPSPSVFSSECTAVNGNTILGVVKKESLSTKSKKKVKHVFCIVNDVQNCNPTRDYDFDVAFVADEYDETKDADICDHQTSIPGSQAPHSKELTNTHIRKPDLEGQPKSTTSSLASENTTTQARMHTFVNNMENKIRLGDSDARWQMQRVLPLQCYVDIYSRSFEVLGASCINSINIDPHQHHKHLQTGSNTAMCVHLGMLPDITILLHQCMMPTKQYEDDLIILIRSCIPFFQNPRRVKHDHAWPEQNDKTLCMLLKWCMPSMLSLYPQVCVKDVNFEVRIGIMRLFRELLVGSFEDRNKFYLRHKTLVKMCLMEYIYYIIQNVNALPETKYIKSININVMGTNVFNIGQVCILHPRLRVSRSVCVCCTKRMLAKSPCNTRCV